MRMQRYSDTTEDVEIQSYNDTEIQWNNRYRGTTENGEIQSVMQIYNEI